MHCNRWYLLLLYSGKSFCKKCTNKLAVLSYSIDNKPVNVCDNCSNKIKRMSRSLNDTCDLNNESGIDPPPSELPSHASNDDILSKVLERELSSEFKRSSPSASNRVKSTAIKKSLPINSNNPFNITNDASIMSKSLYVKSDNELFNMNFTSNPVSLNPLKKDNKDVFSDFNNNPFLDHPGLKTNMKPPTVKNPYDRSNSAPLNKDNPFINTRKKSVNQNNTNITDMSALDNLFM